MTRSGTKRTVNPSDKSSKRARRTGNLETEELPDIQGNSIKSGKQPLRYRESGEKGEELGVTTRTEQDSSEKGDDDDDVADNGESEKEVGERGPEGSGEERNEGQPTELTQTALERIRQENERLRKQLQVTAAVETVPKVIGASTVSTNVSSSIGTNLGLDLNEMEEIMKQPFEGLRR